MQSPVCWLRIIQSKPNIFQEHFSHTLSKANKVQSYCVSLGNPTPELTIK